MKNAVGMKSISASGREISGVVLSGSGPLQEMEDLFTNRNSPVGTSSGCQQCVKM